MTGKDKANASKFCVVCHPLNSHEAGMIREALDAVGIPVYVNNENYYNTGAVRGIGADAMRVMVPHQFVDQATDIVTSLGLGGRGEAD